MQAPTQGNRRKASWLNTVFAALFLIQGLAVITPSASAEVLTGTVGAFPTVTAPVTGTIAESSLISQGGLYFKHNDGSLRGIDTISNQVSQAGRIEFTAFDDDLSVVRIVVTQALRTTWSLTQPEYYVKQDGGAWEKVSHTADSAGKHFIKVTPDRESWSFRILLGGQSWTQSALLDGVRVFGLGSASSVLLERNEALWWKFTQEPTGFVIDFDPAYGKTNEGSPVVFNKAFLASRGITNPVFEWGHVTTWKPLEAQDTGTAWRVRPDSFSQIGVHESATGETDAWLRANNRPLLSNQFDDPDEYDTLSNVDIANSELALVKDASVVTIDTFDGTRDGVLAGQDVVFPVPQRQVEADTFKQNAGAVTTNVPASLPAGLPGSKILNTNGSGETNLLVNKGDEIAVLDWDGSSGALTSLETATGTVTTASDANYGSLWGNYYAVPSTGSVTIYDRRTDTKETITNTAEDVWSGINLAALTGTLVPTSHSGTCSSLSCVPRTEMFTYNGNLYHLQAGVAAGLTTNFVIRQYTGSTWDIVTSSFTSETGFPTATTTNTRGIDFIDASGTAYLMLAEAVGAKIYVRQTGAWATNAAANSGVTAVAGGSPETFHDGTNQYMVLGRSDGLFTGYRRSGAAWVSDTAIVSGLVDVGSQSTPTVFTLGADRYLISGELDGTFNGYRWTGSAWTADSSIVSGLPDVGDESLPEVFAIGGTTYMLAGEGSGQTAVNGFRWTGSAWTTDSTITTGWTTSESSSFDTWVDAGNTYAVRGTGNAQWSTMQWFAADNRWNPAPLHFAGLSSPASTAADPAVWFESGTRMLVAGWASSSFFTGFSHGSGIGWALIDGPTHSDTLLSTDPYLVSGALHWIEYTLSGSTTVYTMVDWVPTRVTAMEAGLATTQPGTYSLPETYLTLAGTWTYLNVETQWKYEFSPATNTWAARPMGATNQIADHAESDATVYFQYGGQEYFGSVEESTDVNYYSKVASRAKVVLGELTGKGGPELAVYGSGGALVYSKDAGSWAEIGGLREQVSQAWMGDVQGDGRWELLTSSSTGGYALAFDGLAPTVHEFLLTGTKVLSSGQINDPDTPYGATVNDAITWDGNTLSPAIDPAKGKATLMASGSSSSRETLTAGLSIRNHITTYQAPNGSKLLYLGEYTSGPAQTLYWATDHWVSASTPLVNDWSNGVSEVEQANVEDFASATYMYGGIQKWLTWNIGNNFYSAILMKWELAGGCGAELTYTQYNARYRWAWYGLRFDETTQQWIEYSSVATGLPVPTQSSHTATGGWGAKLGTTQHYIYGSVAESPSEVDSTCNWVATSQTFTVRGASTSATSWSSTTAATSGLTNPDPTGCPTNPCFNEVIANYGVQAYSDGTTTFGYWVYTGTVYRWTGSAWSTTLTGYNLASTICHTGSVCGNYDQGAPNSPALVGSDSFGHTFYNLVSNNDVLDRYRGRGLYMDSTTTRFAVVHGAGVVPWIVKWTTDVNMGVLVAEHATGANEITDMTHHGLWYWWLGIGLHDLGIIEADGFVNPANLDRWLIATTPSGAKSLRWTGTQWQQDATFGVGLPDLLTLGGEFRVFSNQGVLYLAYQESAEVRFKVWTGAAWANSNLPAISSAAGAFDVVELDGVLNYIERNTVALTSRVLYLAPGATTWLTLDNGALSAATLLPSNTWDIRVFQTQSGYHAAVIGAASRATKGYALAPLVDANVGYWNIDTETDKLPPVVGYRAKTTFDYGGQRVHLVNANGNSWQAYVWAGASWQRTTSWENNLPAISAYDVDALVMDGQLTLMVSQISTGRQALTWSGSGWIEDATRVQGLPTEIRELEALEYNEKTLLLVQGSGLAATASKFYEWSGTTWVIGGPSTNGFTTDTEGARTAFVLDGQLFLVSTDAGGDLRHVQRYDEEQSLWVAEVSISGTNPATTGTDTFDAFVDGRTVTVWHMLTGATGGEVVFKMSTAAPFKRGTSVTVPCTVNQAYAVDLNFDAWTDALALCATGEVYAYERATATTFAAGLQIAQVVGAREIAAADFDEDANMEVMVWDGTDAKFYSRNSAGSWVLEGQVVLGSNAYQGFAVGVDASPVGRATMDLKDVEIGDLAVVAVREDSNGQEVLAWKGLTSDGYGAWADRITMASNEVINDVCLEGTVAYLAMSTGVVRVVSLPGAGFTDLGSTSDSPPTAIWCGSELVIGRTNGGIERRSLGGTIRWGPTQSSDGSVAAIIVQNGLDVLAAYDEARLTKLDYADGDVVWGIFGSSAAKVLSGLHPVAVAPVSGTQFAIAYQSGLVQVLDLADAAVDWDATLGLPPTSLAPTSDGLYLFVGHESGAISKVNMTSHEVLWGRPGYAEVHAFGQAPWHGSWGTTGPTIAVGRTYPLPLGDAVATVDQSGSVYYTSFVLHEGLRVHLDSEVPSSPSSTPGRAFGITSWEAMAPRVAILPELPIAGAATTGWAVYYEPNPSMQSSFEWLAGGTSSGLATTVGSLLDGAGDTAGSFVSSTLSGYYQINNGAVQSTAVGGATVSIEWRSGTTPSYEPLSWTTWQENPPLNPYYQYRLSFTRPGLSNTEEVTVSSILLDQETYRPSGTGTFSWAIPGGLQARYMTLYATDSLPAGAELAYQVRQGTSGAWTDAVPGEQVDFGAAANILQVRTELTRLWDTPRIGDISIDWSTDGEQAYLGATQRTAGSTSEVNAATVEPVANVGATTLAVPVSGRVSGVINVTAQTPETGAARWSFNGDAEDDVGGYDATLAGPTGAVGRWGQAYAFDGVDDYASLPSMTGIIPAAASFSLEAWVYTEQCNHAGGGNLPRIFVIGGKFQAWLTSACKFQVELSSPTLQGHVSTATVPLNAWTHVAASWNATNDILTYYVNGVYDSSSVKDHAGTSSGSTGSIGGTSGLNRQFKGRIDETAVYDYVLTPSDIAALYASGPEAVKSLRAETSLANVGKNEYYYDANDKFVYIGVTARQDAPVERTIAATYGADFDFTVPTFIESGDYYVISGIIRDVDGAPVDNVVAEATFQQNGAIIHGPVKKYIVNGNIEAYLSTNQVPPGAYEVELSFRDTNNVVFSSVHDLILGSDTTVGGGSGGGNNYAGANVFLSFFDQDTGLALPNDLLKTYGSLDTTIDASDRLVDGRLSAATGQTVYVKATDYWGSQIYPTVGPYQAFSITGREQFIDLGLNMVDFKIKNTNSSTIHVHIQKGAAEWSQYVLPQEIVHLPLLPADYVVELDYYNSVTGAFQQTVTQTVPVNSDMFYWIKGHDLADIVIEINNVGADIGDQIVNVGVNVNNVQSTIGTQVTNVQTTVENLQTDIETQLNNMLSEVNNDNAVIQNQVNSLQTQLTNFQTDIENQVNNFEVSVSNQLTTVGNQVNAVSTQITNLDTSISTQINTLTFTVDNQFKYRDETQVLPGQVGHWTFNEVQGQGSQVLTNGGFETYTTTPGAPDGWTASATTATKETTVFSEGAQAVKLTRTATGGTSSLSSTTFTLTGSKSYEFSYDARSGGSYDCHAKVRNTSDNVDITSTTGTSSSSAWKRITQTFPGLAGKNYQVQLQANNGGASGTFCYFDNVYVREIYAKDEANGKNGVLSAGSNLMGPTIGVNGKARTAYQFDGANDYIDVPSLPLPFTSAQSVALWFKAEEQVSSSGVMFQLHGSNGLRAFIDDATSNLVVRMTTAGTTVDQVVSTGKEDNAWHHGIFTYDGANVRTYIDGALVNTVAATGAVAGALPGKLVIGAGNSGSVSNFYTGTLDDLHVYDRALTTEDVAYLYNAGSPIQQFNSLNFVINNNDANIQSQLTTISNAINNNDASIDTQLNTIYSTVTNNQASITTQINSVITEIQNTESDLTIQINNVGTQVTNTETTITNQVNGVSTQITNLQSGVTTQFNTLQFNIDNQFTYHDQYQPLPGQVAHWGLNEVAGTGSNLVANPGMETYATTPGAPGSWVLSGTTVAADVVRETTIVHGGTNAVRITNGAATESKIAQTLTGLTAGQSYFVSAFLRNGASGTSGRLFVYDNTDAQTVVSIQATTQTYTKAYATFQAVSGHSYSVLLGTGSSVVGHQVYADDVVVQAIVADNLAGTSYDGQLSGATTTSGPTIGVNGRIGTAYSFDGVNDRVVAVMDNNVLRNGQESQDWTIEAWFQAAGAPPTSESVIAGRSGFHGGIVQNVGNSGRDIACQAYDSTASAWRKVSYTLPDNLFHHIAMVYDDRVMTCYVDGVSRGTATMPANGVFPASYATNFYIGGLSTTYAVKGTVDEVVAYDRALSASEVSYRFDAPTQFYQYNSLNVLVNNQGTNIQSQLNTIATTINNNDASVDSQLNTIYTTVTNNQAAITTQVNALSTQLSNTGADLQVQINGVSTQITNQGTTLGTQINGVSTQVTNLDTSITSQFNTLQFTVENEAATIQTQVNDLDLKIDNNDASIDAQLNTISTAINNNDASVDTQLNTIYTTITNNQAAVTTQVNNVMTAIDNLGSDLELQINSVEAEVTNQGSTIQAQVNSVSTQISNLDSSVTAQYNTLSTQLTNTGTTIGNQVNSVSLAISNHDTNMETQTNAILASIENSNVSIVAQTNLILSEITNTESTIGAQINTLSQQVSNNHGALTAQVNSFETSVNNQFTDIGLQVNTVTVAVHNAETNITAQTNAIQAQITNVASALGTQVNSVSVQISNLDSSIQTQVNQILASIGNTNTNLGTQINNLRTEVLNGNAEIATQFNAVTVQLTNVESNIGNQIILVRTDIQDVNTTIQNRIEGMNATLLAEMTALLDNMNLRSDELYDQTVSVLGSIASSQSALSAQILDQTTAILDDVAVRSDAILAKTLEVLDALPDVQSEITSQMNLATLQLISTINTRSDQVFNQTLDILDGLPRIESNLTLEIQLSTLGILNLVTQRSDQVFDQTLAILEDVQAFNNRTNNQLLNVSADVLAVIDTVLAVQQTVTQNITSTLRDVNGEVVQVGNRLDNRTAEIMGALDALSASLGDANFTGIAGVVEVVDALRELFLRPHTVYVPAFNYTGLDNDVLPPTSFMRAGPDLSNPNGLVLTWGAHDNVLVLTTTIEIRQVGSSSWAPVGTYTSNGGTVIVKDLEVGKAYELRSQAKDVSGLLEPLASKENSANFITYTVGEGRPDFLQFEPDRTDSLLAPGPGAWLLGLALLAMAAIVNRRRVA